jgi:hypothetical protein
MTPADMTPRADQAAQAGSRVPSPDGAVAMFGPSPPQAVSVARVGNLRWTEVQVFATVGSWVTSTPEHDVRVALAGMARHAAWRASALADRLPVVGALAATVVTVPRHGDLVAVMDQVAGLGSTADRLTVLGDVVLAGLHASSSALLETLSPVADASLLRVLPMVMDDLSRDREAATTLVARPDSAGNVAGDGSSASPTAAAVAAALADAGGW